MARYALLMLVSVIFGSFAQPAAADDVHICMNNNGAPATAADGTKVAAVSSLSSAAPLPPGKYTIEIEGQKLPVELAEGQRVVIKIK